MEVTASIRSLKEIDGDVDKSYVVRGAQMRCSLGSMPSRLNLPKCHGVYLKDKPQINIMDHKPFYNIRSFETCKGRKGPCVPSTPSPWVEGKDDVLIDRQPALLNTSILFCTNGGTIRIADDGQEWGD
jgi:hypothetical protein